MWVIAVLAVVALGFCARSGGGVWARMEKDFYALDDSPEFVMVRMYGDLIVSVRVDMATERFTGEYAVMKLGDQTKSIHLRHVRLDRRRPVFPEGIGPKP